MACAYDLVLLESARAGDARAIESLLAQAHPDIRRYALKSCALSEDAEDAVQTALMAVHRNLGNLRVLTSFSGWLPAIVKRECVRLGKLSMRWIPGIDFDQDARFQRLPADELRLDVAKAIESLPDAYRDFVKARLHRARKLLREYLETPNP